jgi:dihydroflavonol-4-reductase
LAALVRHSRRDAAEVYQVNIEGTQGMVRLAAHHGCRMVFVSTSGTVGCFRDPRAMADEDAPFCDGEVGTWPYYNSKIKAEKAGRSLAAQLGVELVIVRPPIMLGPGDHRFRSTGHVIRFLRRRLPFLIRGGIHFVDIRDVSQALIEAMRHPAPQHVYHLQGTACSIDRFFTTLEEISGIPQPKLHLPFHLAWMLAKACEWIGVHLRGEPLHLLPDPVVVEMATKYWGVRSLYAARDLGFASRDGRETLQDTVAWLQENHRDLRQAS